MEKKEIVEQPEVITEPEASTERASYTILYFIISKLMFIVLFVLVIIQFIFSRLRAKPNNKLLVFSKAMAEYTKQLVEYIGLNTNEKPWPVGHWPKNL